MGCGGFLSWYLNGFARRLTNGPPEASYALEYWGHAYREGAAWLLRHAEPGAGVFVPIAGHCADPYLEAPSRRGSLRAFRNESGRETHPRYLMFITRREEYGDFIRTVERESVPVFTVERAGATLLKIYRSDA